MRCPKCPKGLGGFFVRVFLQSAFEWEATCGRCEASPKGYRFAYVTEENPLGL